ncbi:MAG: periplasmic heavy metal sensor [Pseudomonas sp.]
MNISTLRLALTVSLLFNLGVLGALGWQQLAGLFSESADPLLVRELQLDDQQRQHWERIEQPFLHELNQSSLAVQQQRNRLVDSIFSEPPDAERIAAEQAALAEQQNHQQQLVIEQLLREREILNTDQRQRLAQLLTRQPSLSSEVQILHDE